MEEKLHVAGVGGRTVEDLGRPWDSSHLLGERRVLGEGKAGAVHGIGEKEVPEAGLPSGRLELADDFRAGSAVVGSHPLGEEAAQSLCELHDPRRRCIGHRFPPAASCGPRRGGV